ncbi:hypothetical protein EJ04DRAFT_441202, partial [Polyplosphaeria fusca]
DEPPPYPKASQQGQVSQTNDAAAQSRAILGKLTPRPVKFDMASGRVRFFGPTTNMHILSRSTSDPGKMQETFWPISTLVRDLSPVTHDYLIDLFFDYHNSALHIVHKWAFLDDLKSGGTQFYSNFLHMTMLAEGYRYADMSRPDIKKFACQDSDSSMFHTKAKKMAELELVKPGGVPSIQAFSLLGDLEVGIGRDDTGWMFAGMAFRLLFDVGLHVDPCELRLTEREVQIRHMVLWACIMNDVYWALYLGRPTTLKAFDIAPACLNKDFDRLIESQTRTYAYEKTIETRVYEALLQLMDLLEPLCETKDLRKNLKPADAYLKIATLDRALNNWYADLPERLRWTTENVANAPPSFYLLHTQYHTALILLHRTFPSLSSPSAPQTPVRHSGSTHFSALSRSVCVANAVEVASIISHYRARFPIQRVFVTGLQHVGTAATALMAEVSTLQADPDAAEPMHILGHLKELRDAMRDMQHMYQPANLMATVVEHFLHDEERDHSGGTKALSIDPNLPSSEHLASSSKLPIHLPMQSTTANQASRSDALGTDIPLPNTTASSQAPTRGTATPVWGAQASRAGFDGAGLPFLPSSWFEEMNWEEDREFLNLMGLRDLQGGEGLFEAGFGGLGGEGAGGGVYDG